MIKIIEKILDQIDTAFWTIDSSVDGVFDWIRFRTINKSHLKVRSLPPGYYDLDTKILHAVFDALSDFVEIESATGCFYSDQPAPGKYSRYIEILTNVKYPKDKINKVLCAVATDYDYIRNRGAFKKFIENNKYRIYPHWFLPTKRNEYLGIGKLCFEIDSVNETYDDIHEEEYFKDVSKVSQEILEIYVWWKHIRPNRPDPEVASGISYYQYPAKDTNKEKYEELLKKYIAIERQYFDEDVEKLHRLINVRSYLWS